MFSILGTSTDLESEQIEFIPDILKIHAINAPFILESIVWKCM